MENKPKIEYRVKEEDIKKMIVFLKSEAIEKIKEQNNNNDNINLLSLIKKQK